MPDAVSKTFAMCAASMLLSGATTMSLRDYMDVQHFHFPIHWVWMGLLGYSLLLPIHTFCVKPQDPGRLPFMHADAHVMPLRCVLVCLLFDSVGMCLGYCAMGTLSAAVVQMMRSTKLIITFVISIKILGRKQLPRHYVGVFFTLCGLLLVIVGSFGHSKHHGKLGGSGHGVVGALLLCFCAEMTNTGLYLYQEFVTKKFDAQPLELVGKMGVMGVLFWSGVLCVLNATNIESTRDAMDKMSESGGLQVTAICYTLCAAVFDLSGVWVSKEGSAVGRAMIDVTRSALIWGVELTCRWVQFKILHGLGFLIIVCGTLVYNGVIEIPGGNEESKDDTPAEVEKQEAMKMESDGATCDVKRRVIDPVKLKE
eukprot:gnl/TRDRNA2_/TRDRNA2_192471_c0_seq1.p1 gnl/TRDRNA2_/TRDRNA2_192471_c0~~gnl/TRDRNA2_/TRDRNA2_192471_c0_seq1.p1  ORF type:complete len:401 (-),score=33.99 gnl/TRDRNA2_/TRDRNA2_192471_c0_seq1:170-1273(-)